MTLLRFARLSDAPPPARELVDVGDDGEFTGWRSQGPLVGACRGTVPDLSHLRALVARAGAEPAPETGVAALDATIDSLDAADQTLEVPAQGRVPGAWGDLLEAVRQLIDDTLPGSPSAAVALVIASPDQLRLEHRGDRPLVLELGAGDAEITRWRDGNPVASAEVADLGLERVTAGPGWVAQIALRGPRGQEGDLLTASARFVAEDGGVMIPVVLTGRLIAS